MSRMPWLRLYSRIVDDDKVRLLAFEDRWHFVALLCLKCEGVLDEPNESLRLRKISVKLGLQAREIEEVFRRLEEVGLTDTEGNPIKWDSLQFKSDHDNTAAERKRRQRAREAQKYPVTGASRVTSRTCHKDVTRPEEEEDTETDTELPPSEVGRAPSGAPPPAGAKSSRSRSKKPITDDFEVTADMVRWASEKGFGHVDLLEATDEFIDYWKSRGDAKADWVATWRNDIRRKAERQRSGAARSAGPQSHAARLKHETIHGKF